MARKKRKTASSLTRTRTRVVKVNSRRKKSTSFKPMNHIIGGMVYGAGRTKVSQLISPITSKIPMGQYADELGMGILSYFAAKGKFGSQFKTIGLAGLHIESAMVGTQLMRGFNTGNTNTQSGVIVL